MEDEMQIMFQSDMGLISRSNYTVYTNSLNQLRHYKLVQFY